MDDPAPKFQTDKFKCLVHYICYKADRDELGATKLNKILWFSDIWHYLTHGRTITGETYVKHHYGPVPKHIEPVLWDLQSSGMIQVRDAEYFGYPKKEYITIRKPDLSCFTADEISSVNDIIDDVCKGHTAASISALSHNRAWELAEIGEEIPCFTVFAGDPSPINQSDIDWACQSIAEDASANG